MFCTNCGNKLNDGDKFCSKCGHAIKSKVIKEEVIKKDDVKEKNVRKENIKKKATKMKKVDISDCIMIVFLLIVSIVIVLMVYDKNIITQFFGKEPTTIESSNEENNNLSLDTVKVGVRYKSVNELDEASNRIASVAWSRVKEIYPNAVHTTIYFIDKDDYGRYVVGFDILKDSSSETTSGINVVVYVEDINDWNKIRYYKNVANAYAGQLESNYDWGKPVDSDSLD